MSTTDVAGGSETRLDPRALRDAFGTFLTGVTVVTAAGEDGARVGFTANSFASVSMDPPLLLVCPARRLSSFPVFAACERFAVSVLAEDQQDASNVFATSRGDRFTEVSWHADRWDCPLIEGAAAHFSCRTHQRTDAGDHLILIGEVERFASFPKAGLGYWRGGYLSLDLERRAGAPGREGRRFAGAIVERDGDVLVQETAAGVALPRTPVAGRAAAHEAVSGLLARAGVPASVGPVFSVFDDTASGDSHTFYRASASGGDGGDLGRYLPAAALARERFASPAEGAMIERYAAERALGSFGLYVGDETRGDVQRLAQEAGP